MSRVTTRDSDISYQLHTSKFRCDPRVTYGGLFRNTKGVVKIPYVSHSKKRLDHADLFEREQVSGFSYAGCSGPQCPSFAAGFVHNQGNSGHRDGLSGAIDAYKRVSPQSLRLL